MIPEETQGQGKIQLSGQEIDKQLIRVKVDFNTCIALNVKSNINLKQQNKINFLFFK